MKVERGSQIMVLLGAGFLTAACGSESPPTSTEPAPTPTSEHSIQAGQLTYPNAYSDGKNANYDKVSVITRLSNAGNIFLVTRNNDSKGNEYNGWGDTIASGEQFMRDQGCEISDIKPISAGDLVTVTNPSDCLPKLE